MNHQTLTVVGGESILDHNFAVMNNHAITTKGDELNPRRKPSYPLKKAMIFTILSLLLLSTPIQAQRNDDDLCSCSPREYYFKLDLSAICPDLPPPFPPNDVFGGGVKDYTCTIGPEPVPGEKDNMENDRTRSAVPFSEDVRKLQQDDFIIPEIIDPEPVVIDSIQFFEVDTEFNVINQDPSYVRDVEFKDGDMFNYTSISDMFSTSGKENYSVPGGINMVLRGYNAAGERVRNVFTITFTNECGVPTFEAGDEIGWVVFDSFVPASDDTCRSVQPEFPTPAPESEYYGLAKKPTRRPTSSQSKPDSMSMDFNMLMAKFQRPRAPKVHKMTSPEDMSYQFIQVSSGKSSKENSYNDRVSAKRGKSSGGKSGKSSGGKSGKSSKSKGSKDSNYEPLRNLRATLDQVDLDNRGAKPSRHTR